MMPAAAQPPFQLQRLGLGAIPILDTVIQRIGLEKQLAETLGQPRYAQAIVLLLNNIAIERHALYAIEEWSSSYDPARVYGGKFADDVLARALDSLFKADRASLLTSIVLAAVRAYSIDLSQIHQDTTSVKLTGAYHAQERRAVQLVRGHSKDHRPDLLQMVYELSVTKDGAIPILFKVHDGNRTDDSLHWENWQMLRGLIGRSDFLYVADSKLCVSQTMRHIDGNQGRFITVVPHTRAEVKEFHSRMESSLVRWDIVMMKRSRGAGGIDRYDGASGLDQLREGFRLYWFRSSAKARRDGEQREDRIAAAMARLEALGSPARKKRPKTEAKMRQQADAILAHFSAAAWIQVHISTKEVEKFRQVSKGRATADTVYRRVVRRVPQIVCSRDQTDLPEKEDPSEGH